MKKVKINITKPLVLRKGKKVFGSASEFSLWLNKDHMILNCKPITLWETKKGLTMIYDELTRIEYGDVC